MDDTVNDAVVHMKAAAQLLEDYLPAMLLSGQRSVQLDGCAVQISIAASGYVVQIREPNGRGVATITYTPERRKR